MNLDAKLRPFYLLKILQERTDEDNFLTTNQLCDILKEEYGLETHRVTIKTDIGILQKVGYGIEEQRSTQNRYRYVHREFETDELRTIIGAVAKEDNLPKTKKKKLIAKIAAFAGKKKAKELKRGVGIYSTKKSELQERTQIIHDAILYKRKISFRANSDGKSKSWEYVGEKIVFSPYVLIWEEDDNYVVGYSDNSETIYFQSIGTMIEEPVILQEDAVPKPDGFGELPE